MPEPLSKIFAALGLVWGLITAIIAAAKALGAISVAGGILKIGGVAIGSAAAGGAIAGSLAAIATIIVIGLYALDRCTQGEGLRECVSGVVVEIVSSFEDALDELFPFSAMHDRVDVLVKSRFWDVVEDGNAFVFCTDMEPPRRSEILRCYFYDRRVCEAASGALIGGTGGAVIGIIAAAAIAAAIGCATIILCLFALLIAALIAVAAVLIGALIGGQIAKEAATDDSPTAATGETLAVGYLISVYGNMQRRAYDQDANVIYWATNAQFHGTSSSPQPFSYCEIDDELAMDGCPLAPVDIR